MFERKTIPAIILGFAAALQSGCAHGFNREGLREGLRAQTENQAQGNEAPATISADEIRASRNLRPQLKFPFSLAVYDAGGCPWTSGRHDELLKSEAELKERGVVSKMFFFNSANAPDSNLRAARLAAAAEGADAVLYLRCASEEDRHLNSLALFYVTILGYFAVPGHTIDSLVMLDGAIWDTRSEYLYLSVESEATDSLRAPGASIDYKQPPEGAKRKAIADFSQILVDRLTDLRRGS